MQCDACSEGFYLSGDSVGDQLACSACLANCETCSNKDICDTCQNGFVGDGTESCKVEYAGICDGETLLCAEGLLC